MATNIGTGPQDIPLNQFLGEMAFMDNPPGPPAFATSATGGPSLPSSSTTLINFNVVNLDNYGGYNATLYRYTPKRPGWYQFNAGLTIAGSILGNSYMQLRKNGGEHRRFGQFQSELSTFTGSALAVANGTTDYFEIAFVNGSGTAETTLATGACMWFDGYWVTNYTA